MRGTSKSVEHEQLTEAFAKMVELICLSKITKQQPNSNLEIYCVFNGDDVLHIYYCKRNVGRPTKLQTFIKGIHFESGSTIK